MQKKEVVQLMYKIKVLFHGTLFYLIATGGDEKSKSLFCSNTWCGKFLYLRAMGVQAVSCKI
jgi:hypothetical protein